MEDEIETAGDLVDAAEAAGGELRIPGYVVKLIGRWPMSATPIGAPAPMPNRSYWLDEHSWADPDCIECDGSGAPCCEPPDHPYAGPERQT